MFCEAQSRRRLHQTPALRNCNYKLTLKTLGWPVLKLHAERKTVGSEDFLDLVQGLAAQIRGLQEFVLGALDQIADVGDALGLQAVRGANREFEVINRTHKNRIKRRRIVDGAFFLGFSLVSSSGLDGAEDRQLILEDADGFAESFFRRDNAVRQPE
jgi:hypothetical protein